MLGSCAVLVLISGCAIQNQGFVAGRVCDSATARTVDIYAVGLALNATDLGATCSLGLRRDSFLMAPTIPTRPGSRKFIWSLPADVDLDGAVARASRVLGGDLHFTAAESGLSLGYCEQILIQHDVSGAGRIVVLEWDPGRPDGASVAVCDVPGQGETRRNGEPKEEQSEAQVRHYCWSSRLAVGLRQ